MFYHIFLNCILSCYLSPPYSPLYPSPSLSLSLQVTTATNSGKHTPSKFLSSEKSELLLPDEMSSFHVDFTEYYFPDGINYPGSACIYAIRSTYLISFNSAHNILSIIIVIPTT